MLDLIEYIPVSPLGQKLIGAGIIIFVTVIAAYLVTLFLKVLVGRITRKTETELDDALLAGSKKPIIVLVYLFGFSVLLNYLESLLVKSVGESVFNYLDGFIYAAGVLTVATLVIKIISTALKWYATTIAAKTETSVDDEFIPLLDRAFKIIVYALAALVVLDHFAVDVKGLIAVLGVGSLAIALAAQETIANMIGGFVIMIDRPFRNGDWIQFDADNICKVHQIGVRSTKLWTFDNSLIIVPNAELMKSTIHNLTYPYPDIRARVTVGVSYSADIQKVREILLDIAANHKNILKDPKPVFRFKEFGDSSLNVIMIFTVESIPMTYDISSDVRIAILNRFREENIEIPFPQRVVTFVNNPNDVKSEE